MVLSELGTFTGKRILLAAESDLGRARLEKFLVSQRYSVDEAVTGEQVLDRIVTDVFDLCIIDYGLPGKSFHSIINYLNDILCFTPIVVMVCNVKCSFEQNAAMPVPLYLLVKPFSLSDFGSIVSSIVGRAGITVTTRVQRSRHHE